MRHLHRCALVLLALTFAHSARTQEVVKKPAPPAKEAEWVTYDDAGVKVLIRYLKEEKEPLLLRMSLDTLARLGDQAKPAVAVVVAILKHPNGQIRLEAARTLIDVGAETEAALRTLTATLEGRDAALRARAASVLGDLANPPFEWSSCWGPGPRPPIRRPALGKQVVPALLATLKDREASVRSSAAYGLGRVGADAKATLPALLAAFEDRDATVRQAAATAARAIVNDAAARAGVK